jgi:hypothetical protein
VVNPINPHLLIGVAAEQVSCEMVSALVIFMCPSFIMASHFARLRYIRVNLQNFADPLVCAGGTVVYRRLNLFAGTRWTWVNLFAEMREAARLPSVANKVSDKTSLESVVFC